jgi:hypothetical protein
MARNPVATLAVVALVLVVGVVVDFAARGGGAPETHAALRPPRVEDGAASLDELIARFLEAVRAKDRGALEELRFTEEEYRRVILPYYDVARGQPPQRISEKASKYFYDTMNTKSYYHRENILNRFGGTPFTLKGHRFGKEIQKFAEYTAYPRITLTLVDASGEEIDLATGSIAEVDGHYKFASYIRD